MTNSPAAIVHRVWSCAHVLKDDGLAFMDYTEQITYLLFLKMAAEQPEIESSEIPERYRWRTLKRVSDNVQRLARYHQGLRKLSERPGLLGLIFTKPQSKINDPAKLQLLMQMIDAENWSAMDNDVKGAAYEGLLARNAEDVRGGAGQYFTPRPVVRAIVQVMRPEPMMRIVDPACGTGGFLLEAFAYLKHRTKGRTEIKHLRTRSLHGVDLVPNVARLCAMNLFLHGIGTDHTHPVISICDSLESSMEPVDMVLTNPPFGKKSSFTIVGSDGKGTKDSYSNTRKDFWATTSNKQLNFVQHVFTLLKANGRAAIVVPDNVLFETGAGERIRRALLHSCDVHTLLRLPTGIWYSPGVKANVLFFDKKPTRDIPATKNLWVYNLRSTRNFSLRQNPLTSADLANFVDCYSTNAPAGRRENHRFRRFSYADVMNRQNANLDIQWQLEEPQERETHRSVARDILGDLRVAMKEFAALEKYLR
jgi:type I restriction enzyme M protein